MIALLAGVAWSQDYAFPSELDASLFYPTAYYDHGGVTDWNCGSVTYSGHRGSDFGVGGFAGMDAGRTVTAAAEGVVIYTNDGEFDRCTSGDCAGGGGFGNWVQVEHPDGKTTIYGHLKQWTVAVAVGDVVTCGTPLGEVGSSGYSTGPHLHFEVRDPANTAEDPFDGPCSYPPTYWTTQGAYEGLPGEACGPPPVCEPTGPLRCGDVLDVSNDGPGSVRRTHRYGCVDFTYSGPEQVWSLELGSGGPVTLSMTGLSADLDLFVTDSVACDGTGCVGASSNPDGADEQVDFVAAAGVPYTVIVDGWEGAVSGLHLEVTCDDDAPPPPQPHTGDVRETGGRDTGDPDDGEPPTDPTGPKGDETHVSLGGCSCDTAGGGAWWLVAAALVARRRR